MNIENCKEELSSKIVTLLRNTELVSKFQCRIVDPIAHLCGHETPAQAIGHALTQGVNLGKLQNEIDGLEAMADAIERASGS